MPYDTLPNIDGLLRYLMFGDPVGHFLTAVLENDLMQACHRADLSNRTRIWEYAAFIHHFAPNDAHGSKEKVKQYQLARKLDNKEPYTFCLNGEVFGLAHKIWDDRNKQQKGT